MAKALSWRVVATLITSLVAFGITGSFKIAAEVGLLDTVIKFGVYFVHERMWLRISYGRAKVRDYQI